MDQSLDERRSALEAAFANPKTEGRELTPTGQMQIEQVPFGAVKVAVPRDEAKVLTDLRRFAAAAGDDFYYQWTAKNKDGTKDIIEGPSIKCALYVVRLFGNCDVDVRVQDHGTHWVFYARFTDLETGFRLMRAYQQVKDQNIGIKDKERSRDIAFQIGQSKAIRNVVCNALSPFTDYAFEEAKGSMIEKVGASLEKYREKVARRLEELKVTVDRAERTIGRTIDKWVARDVCKVIAEIQSVNDGMILADELWPPIVSAERPKVEDFKDDEVAPKTVEAKVEPKPEQKADPKPEAKAEPKAATFDIPPIPKGVEPGWWSDSFKRLAMCATPGAVDELQEELERSLDGDSDVIRIIVEACNAKVRNLSRAKK